MRIRQFEMRWSKGTVWVKRLTWDTWKQNYDAVFLENTNQFVWVILELLLQHDPEPVFKRSVELFNKFPLKLVSGQNES